MEAVHFYCSHRACPEVKIGRGAALLPGELGANLLSELQPLLISLSGEDVLFFQLSFRGPVAEFDG